MPGWDCRSMKMEVLSGGRVPLTAVSINSSKLFLTSGIIAFAIVYCLFMCGFS